MAAHMTKDTNIPHGPIPLGYSLGGFLRQVAIYRRGGLTRAALSKGRRLESNFLSVLACGSAPLSGLPEPHALDRRD